MEPINFAYWLKGFFEITETKNLTEKQVQIIKDHLDLVFTKVTPDRTADEFSTLCKEEGISVESKPFNGDDTDLNISVESKPFNGYDSRTARYCSSVKGNSSSCETEYGGVVGYTC